MTTPARSDARPDAASDATRVARAPQAPQAPQTAQVARVARVAVVDILLMNTDRSAFAQRHPDDARKVESLLRPLRPHWNYRLWRAIDGELPSDPLAADAVVMTGSVASVTAPEPWMAPVEDLIRARHAAGRTVVGLCFGHQLIAKALGGQVGRQPQGLRLGTAWTHLRRRAAWMDPPADALRLIAAHEDQVVEPPPDAEVLGGDALCPAGLMTVGPHVLGTQYHPELSPAFLADLLDALAGRLPAEQIERARADVGDSHQPLHAETFARWIVRFIESR